MDLVTYAAATRTRPIDFQRKLKEDHGVAVNEESVRLWLRGHRPPPAKIEILEAIECATDGKVTRHDMRPDVFGKPKRRKAAQHSSAA